jgi:hypothetical protein
MQSLVAVASRGAHLSQGGGVVEDGGEGLAYQHRRRDSDGGVRAHDVPEIELAELVERDLARSHC